MKNAKSRVEDIETATEGDECEYKYDHYNCGLVREEVKKLLDVEFHASVDVLHSLLPFGHDKNRILYEIGQTDLVLRGVSKYEDKYSFRFIDEDDRERCVSRIKARIFSALYFECLTKHYCKKVQNYFWIEERLEEEMSVKLDGQKSNLYQKKMCRNEDLMKTIIGVHEEGRGIKLSEDIINYIIRMAKMFLFDLLKSKTFSTF
ncbi:gamete antigen 27/25 [Plasmodium brasilianum]|uniref:Gamete antigen 27/25 (G27/25) n=2 Tax=Plasmodium (Plasmodium) TaxID=418103 RepID=A0A1A8WJU9_PLAMA|nr:gamete antigen 27/25, putative [Plasmodium malariae]KAI4834595.1 gamete antigen 27/25 [Plasmodium brasilianum]SBS92112.1 gamete antigen 27/25 (G27/25) [Plasmodium malariae]SCP03133.1 gamete antigen 27/25, putative [Plasmodium malariae]